MDNRIGVYYGYFVDTEELLWENYARRAKEAGAGCIEMSALTVSALPAERQSSLAALVRDLDMELTFADALPPGCDFCSEDPRERENASEHLLSHLVLAERMGVKKIGGILQTQGKVFPAGIAFSREEKLKYAAEPLRRVGDRAAEMGITLGIEMVNRFECPLLNTAEEGLRFLRAVGSEGVRLHLDTFHMNIEEADPAEAVRRAGNRLCHIHFAENDRQLPGNGHIDLEAILRALHEIDYRGTIVIEAMTRPYGSFSDRLNIWRDTVKESVDRDLKVSVAYLKDLMAAI